MKTKPKSATGGSPQAVGLKTLAAHLGLSPTTISLVLNDSPAGRHLPQETRDRVWEAARKFNYRPNFFARYLNKKRSYTVGVLVPEISEGYGASVMAGVERRLVREGYFYFVASHRWMPELIEETPRLLLERGAEGFILLNMPLDHPLPVPAVSIGGRSKIRGIINVTLDNERAGYLALQHLAQLGHKRIAFFKGHPGSADTEARWTGICHAASQFGIEIDPRLVLQLERRAFPPEPPVPEEGYDYAQKLLARKRPFSALFAFNDIAAIGAMSAFRNAGLRVPQDVSVVGFDDIQAAAFMNPRLTTIRQPLREMGEVAAKTLLKKIGNREAEINDILVDPELVLRESTAPLQPGTYGPGQD